MTAELFPGAIQIVDLWQSLEHIWAVSKALHGAGSPQAGSGPRRAAMSLSWVRLGKTDPFAREQARRYRARPRYELYDLEADPYEMHNFVDASPVCSARSPGCKRGWSDGWPSRETGVRKPRLPPSSASPTLASPNGRQ